MLVTHDLSWTLSMSWGRGGETVVQGWTTSLAPSVPRRAAVAS